MKNRTPPPRCLMAGVTLMWVIMGAFLPSLSADGGGASDKDLKINPDNSVSVEAPKIVLADATESAVLASIASPAIEPPLASPSEPVLPSAEELFGDSRDKIDQMNEGLLYSWRLANVKAEEVIETLKMVFAKALKDERFILVENKARNTVIAKFPDRKEPELRREWGQMMATLDRSVEQALIEVLIVELVLDENNQWGADLQALAESVVGGNEFVQSLGAGLGGSTMDATAAGIDGLKYFVTNGNKLKALMFAGQTTNRTRVLSSPQIIASNHKPATFKLGQTLPIQTGTVITNGVTSYTYTEKDIGINISLTPHFDSGARINLDINQEVNTLLTYDKALRVAQFAHKTLTSNVTLRSGETVVLGGYIQNSNLLNRKNVPGLDKIPFFGKFLNRDTNTDQKIEVMVFITPKVLADKRYIGVKDMVKKDLFKEKEKIVSQMDSHFDQTPIGVRREQRFNKQEAKAQAMKAAKVPPAPVAQVVVGKAAAQPALKASASPPLAVLRGDQKTDSPGRLSALVDKVRANLDREEGIDKPVATPVAKNVVKPVAVAVDKPAVAPKK